MLLSFYPKQSYSTIIDGFKEELNKIPKKIIINFEDIDRIENREQVLKVLYIAQKLAGGNIKVILQHSQANGHTL